MTTVMPAPVKCPCCHRESAFYMVSSTNYTGDMTTDFRAMFLGADPSDNIIDTCMKCGYTGSLHDYEHPTVTPAEKDLVRRRLGSRLKEMRRKGPIHRGCMFELYAIRKEWEGCSKQELGDTYLQAAWSTYHSSDDELYYRKKAIEYYQKALNEERPDGHEVPRLTYLIAEQFRRAKDPVNAAHWFDLAIQASIKGRDQDIADLATQQKLDPQETLNRKSHPHRPIVIVTQRWEFPVWPVRRKAPSDKTAGASTQRRLDSPSDFLDQWMSDIGIDSGVWEETKKRCDRLSCKCESLDAIVFKTRKGLILVRIQDVLQQYRTMLGDQQHGSSEAVEGPHGRRELLRGEFVVVEDKKRGVTISLSSRNSKHSNLKVSVTQEPKEGDVVVYQKMFGERLPDGTELPFYPLNILIAASPLKRGNANIRACPDGLLTVILPGGHKETFYVRDQRDDL